MEMRCASIRAASPGEPLPIIAAVHKDYKGALAIALRCAGAAAALAIGMRYYLGVSPVPIYHFYIDEVAMRGIPWQQWSTPLAGENVLPPKARTMIELLRAHRVSEFRYSAGIDHGPDQRIPQRLSEGAYPILLAKNARFVVQFEGEPISAGCRIVGRREEVVLADCG
jgi:hypothetical protein